MLEQVSELVEKDLILLGCTAIEDKLQVWEKCTGVWGVLEGLDKCRGGGCGPALLELVRWTSSYSAALPVKMSCRCGGLHRGVDMVLAHSMFLFLLVSF